MKAPLIARILGALLLLAGALAFVPFLTIPADLTQPYISLDVRYVLLFGLFPVNLVHDVLHVVFGLWGIIASFRFASAVRFCRWLGWIYLLLFVMGLIPITNTLFGVAPIYGHDVWLHLIVALAGFFAGYAAPSVPSEDEPELPTPPKAR